MASCWLDARRFRIPVVPRPSDPCDSNLEEETIGEDMYLADHANEYRIAAGALIDAGWEGDGDATR